ncbi:transformer-2 protein homolog alpha-like isoform X2 [Anopheles bellator]|uniref:transformer-2 protein homolog alpha-like isoform X2 n=1 Tax=Anopheles bellator TaxID=139047 RepID=UPI00264759BF|nr:transformer-2 protein homolog alpha-like isoform X2 [Anopheles bellator]
MSHSRNHHYYESSRSRSRDRNYRREYREDSERYNQMTDYGSGSDYRRSSQHHRSHTSHYHEPASSTSAHSSYSYSGKVVLAVFNLSIYTTEAELYDIFSKFGPLRKTTVVLDAKTGRSRGFGFVYFESAEDAKVAHEQANGIEIGDRRIRVDFSATNKPHDPTPGVYYGRVSHPKGSYHSGGGHPPPGMSYRGYHHCRACEVEARDRERWDREAHSRDSYYYDSYSTADRGRDRSSRSRSDYYRSGTSIR